MLENSLKNSGTNVQFTIFWNGSGKKVLHALFTYEGTRELCLLLLTLSVMAKRAESHLVVK